MANEHAPSRTIFATKAVDMATIFNTVFGKEAVVVGRVIYRLEMAAPDGISTAGGVQALQHLSLVPSDHSGSIVLGAANRKEERAELRSFEFIASQYAQRFAGASLPFSRARHGELLAKMEQFFGDRGLRVVIRDAGGDVQAREPVAPTLSRASWLYFGIFVVGVMALAWVVSRLLHRVS